MCFFSQPKAATPPPPAPPPPPVPAPVPTEVSPATDEAARKREADKLKQGVLSTVKTGPQGITGAGPDLSSPSAAGVLYPTMAPKKTLG